MNDVQRRIRLDEWFSELTKTNRAFALAMMFGVQFSPAGEALSDIDIAEKVMDAYLDVLAETPALANRTVYEIETDSNFYSLSEFLPTYH